MAIQISGVSLGTISGGPSAINLSDLHDVLISSPQTGQFLRYNASLSEWQNEFLNTDVYNYLSTNITGSNGITLTALSGPQTIDIGLTLSATGDATGSVAAGSLPLTLSTVNSNVGQFGTASAIPVITVDAKGRITAISTISFGGNAPLATSLANGTTGAIPYQSAPSTTAFLTAGTSSQVLVSGTSPSWTNTPTLTGTNFSSIPNGALTNSSITVNGSPVSLGGSVTITTTPDANTLTGTTLASNVVSSSLTSVGTLTLLNTAGPITINNIGTFTTSTLITSTTTADQVLDQVAIASYRVATYQISVTYGTDAQYSEVKLVHNGTDVFIGEINTVLTGSLLATFTADVSTGIMRLLTTPTNTITTYKVLVTLISI